MKKAERNVGIELMRLVMMLGIVAQHVVGQGAYIRHGIDSLTNWCVCGFVFLAGFYGIRFSVRKCLRLLALGVGWAAFLNISAGNGLRGAARDYSYGYWYL